METPVVETGEEETVDVTEEETVTEEALGELENGNIKENTEITLTFGTNAKIADAHGQVTGVEVTGDGPVTFKLDEAQSPSHIADALKAYTQATSAKYTKRSWTIGSDSCGDDELETALRAYFTETDSYLDITASYAVADNEIILTVDSHTKFKTAATESDAYNDTEKFYRYVTDGQDNSAIIGGMKELVEPVHQYVTWNSFRTPNTEVLIEEADVTGGIEVSATHRSLIFSLNVTHDKIEAKEYDTPIEVTASTSSEEQGWNDLEHTYAWSLRNEENNHTVTLSSESGATITVSPVKAGTELLRVSVMAGDTVIQSKEVQLEIKPEDAYSITWQAKDEAGNDVPVEMTDEETFPKSYKKSETPIDLPDKEAMTVPGYDFRGWFGSYTAPTGESAAAFGDSVTKIEQDETGPKTLTAKYHKHESYDITYVYVNADTNEVILSVQPDNEAELPKSYKENEAEGRELAEAKFNDGYKFAGWYEGEVKEGKVTLGKTVTAIGEDVTGAKTFYGKLYPIYTIRYVYVDVNYDLMNPQPTTDVNNPNEVMSFTSLDSSINLKNATSGKYTVDGWYEGTVSGQKVNFGEKATRIPRGSSGNKTFYARLAEKTHFTVSYKFKTIDSKTLTGVRNGKYNPTDYTNDSTAQDITLNNPEKPGYIFQGWYHADDTNYETKVNTITVSDKKDYSLIGLFKASEPIDNIKLPADIMAVKAGDSANLKAELQKIAGWDPYHTIPVYKTIDESDTDETVIYSSSDERIKVGNNGDVSIPAADELFDTEDPVTASIRVTISARPSRTPVTPAKCELVITKGEAVQAEKIVIKMRKEDGTEVPLDDTYLEAKDSVQNIQLVAEVQDESGKRASIQDVKWEVWSYYLNYNNNKQPAVLIDRTGKLTIPSSKESIHINVTASLAADNEIKQYSNINVLKYYTVSFADEHEFNVLSGKSFQAAEGWDYDLGNILNSANSYELFDAYTASVEKDGYIFTGWSRSDGVSAKTSDFYRILELEDSMPAKDLTITAQWTPKEYSVTYVFKDSFSNASLDEVTNPNTTGKMTVEDKAVTLQNATKEGYNFIGWFKDADCKEKIDTVAVNTEHPDNVTVYGLFTKHATRLSFDDVGELYATQPSGTDPLKTFRHVATLDTGYGYEQPAVTYTLQEGADTYAEIVQTGENAGTVTIKNVNDEDLPEYITVTATATAIGAGGTGQEFNASYRIEIVKSSDTIKDAQKITVEAKQGDDPLRIEDGKVEKAFDFDNEVDKEAVITFSAKVTNNGDELSTTQTTDWELVQGKEYAELTPVKREGQEGVISATLKLNLEKLDETQDLEVKVTADGAANVSTTVTVHVTRHYNLTFDAGTATGDSTLTIPDAMKVEYEKTATITTPTCTGYQFEKWTYPGKDTEGKDADLIFVSGETPMPKKDLKLTAHWVAEQVEVAYSYGTASDDSTKIADDVTQIDGEKISIDFGGTYAQLDESKRPETVVGEILTVTVDGKEEYYRFLGWYTDVATENALDGATLQVNTTTPITIYAKTVRVAKVTFDYNEETPTSDPIPNQYKKDGEKVDKPASDPTASGKKFLKWKAAPSGEDDFDFSRTLDNVEGSDYQTIIVYANWAANDAKETLIFDTKYYSAKYPNGKDISVSGAPSADTYKELPFGQKASAPTDPSATGYKFEGWFTDKSFASDTAFDWTKPLTPKPEEGETTVETTLYAKWVPEKIQVDFYWSGIKENSLNKVTSVYVDYDEALTSGQIPVPTRSGYAFKGFYTTDIHGISGDPENYAEVTDFSAYEAQKAITSESIKNKTVWYAGWQKVTGETGMFDGGFVIVTNLYKSVGEAEVALKNYAEGIGAEKDLFTWGASVSKKANPKSYANGVARAMEVKYNGESFTVPVRFVTISKIALTSEYTRGTESVPALIKEEDKATAHVDYVLNGGSYADPAVKTAVETAMDTLKASAAPVISLPKKSVLRVDAAGDILLAQNATAKKTEKVTVSYKFPAGTLKSTMSVAVSPEVVSIDEDMLELKLGENPVAKSEADPSIGTAAYYRVKAVKNDKLILTGMLADDYDTAYTITATTDNKKVVTAGKVTWKGASSRAEKEAVEFEVPLTLTGKTGTVRITLSANDTVKTSSSILIDVQADKPVFGTTKVTMNQLRTSGVGISVTPGFTDPEVLGFEVTNVTVPKNAKASAEEMENWFTFTASEYTNIYMLVLSADAVPAKLSNGKYNVTVKDDKENYTTLTVTLKAVQPKITVEQMEPLNLKSNSETYVWFHSSDRIDDTRCYVSGYDDETTAPYLFFKAQNDVVGISYNPGNKPTAKQAKKLKITAAFDMNGYRKGAVTKTFTLKVADKLPSVKAAPASVAFYDGLVESAELTFKEGKQDFDIKYGVYRVTTDSKLAGYDVDLDVDSDGNDVVKISRKAGGSIQAVKNGKIYLHHYNYEQPIPVTVSITTPKANKLAAKLSKTTVTLNKYAANDAAVIKVSSNAGGLADISLPSKVDETKAGICIAYDSDEDTVTACWKGGTSDEKKANAASVKRGNYKYTIPVTFTTTSGSTVTKNVTLTVKVVDTNPNTSTNKGKTVASKAIKFTQKGTIDLMNPRSYVTLTPKFSGLNGAKVTDVVLTGRDASLFDYDSGNGVITLSEKPSRMVTGYKYQVIIDSAEVEYANGDTETFAIGQALNLKVTQSKVSVIVDPKSKTVSHIDNAEGREHSFYVHAYNNKLGNISISNIQMVEDAATVRNAIKFKATDIGDTYWNVEMEDGQSGTLKKGTYTVKFLVTFEKQAANAKPTVISYKFTVK